MSGAEVEPPEPGEIHDETGAALASMWLSGLLAGAGGVIALSHATDVLAFEEPVVTTAIALGGAPVLWYIAMKRLPDARTIAVRVNEADDFASDDG